MQYTISPNHKAYSAAEEFFMKSLWHGRYHLLSRSFLEHYISSSFVLLADAKLDLELVHDFRWSQSWPSEDCLHLYDELVDCLVAENFFGATNVLSENYIVGPHDRRTFSSQTFAWEGRLFHRCEVGSDCNRQTVFNTFDEASSLTISNSFLVKRTPVRSDTMDRLEIRAVVVAAMDHDASLIWTGTNEQVIISVPTEFSRLVGLC